MNARGAILDFTKRHIGHVPSAVRGSGPADLRSAESTQTASAASYQSAARPDGGGVTVAISNVSKWYSGTRALSGVDLEVRAGEVHALVGGNGSGKSTLIKILTGVEHADRGGTIALRGLRVDASAMSPDLAKDSGIRVVHQDLGLFPGLSVAQNLCLGYGFITGFAGHIRWRQIRPRVAALIERFEIDATPGTLLEHLSRATRTQIAIARALQDIEGAEGALLILDEPTTALPPHEVELLLKSLRRYAESGQAILFVSHRISEVLGVANRVTVLRDGQNAGTYETSELDEARLIELIVGRAPDTVFPRARRSVGVERQAVQVANLWAGSLRDVSLSVSAGEIVGLAGITGAGQSELLRVLFGDLKRQAGQIWLEGELVAFRHPRDAVNAGVAFVPEDRLAHSAFLDLSVNSNISMTVLSKYRRFGRIDYGLMRNDGAAVMQEFGVKAASETSLLNTLSGGNQQKVVVGRSLRSHPTLLLLDEPTQGVDVGARRDIYGIVRAAVDQGAAALVVASDFVELAEVADRALIFSGGRVVAEVPLERLTAHELMRLTYSRSGRSGDGS
jgi:ribose transport system ATP-binding protein